MMVGQRFSEATLVDAILRSLNYQPGVFAWRMETSGSVRPRQGGGFFMVRNRYGRGKPDIAGCKEGHGFVIEVKKPGEKAKPHQAEWMADYEARGGGKATVAHSVDEALNFIASV